MSSHQTAPLPSQNRMLAAASCFLAGTGMTTFGLQTVLGSFELSSQFISRRMWEQLIAALGASSQTAVNSFEIDPIILFLHLLPMSLVFWLLGAWWIAFRKNQPFRTAIADWGIAGWFWWMIPGFWEVFNFTWEGGAFILNRTASLWFAVAAAGWLAALLTLSGRRSKCGVSADLSTRPSRTPVTVWLLVGLYLVVFSTMNRQLFEGLHVPHGDSAMYEEHLWNVTHGKGFRSYLDGGLFLGEHLQVIHLLLIPLHLFWPSHLLLEVCESLALAAGAVPVYRMARRHSGSHQTAVLLAAAYLLYFPMHCLDIAIDLKTFRPISFGVPFMLFALDQMELKRFRSMLGLLLLALLSKEDFAVVIAMLGIWIALFPPKEHAPTLPGTLSQKSVRLLGTGLALFGVVYLLVVIKLAIPWFREGDVHYAQYFGELGNTPGDIFRSVMTQPELVFGKLFSHRPMVYLLLLLVPVGLVPLLSPGRLAVAAPLFGVLCLLELSPDPVPWHHFHAPLIPIIFWSAACGLNNMGTVTKRISRMAVTRFACSSALATGIVYGFSPLSLTFWDSGSTKHWKKLYVPGERAKLFPKVFALIPSDARVASTDFIHPRFTHHERSYDYSDYPRAVNDGKRGAPRDTNYIVIDTKSRYSEISKPEQIPEFANNPDDWELLHHEAEEYFIILKRRHHD